MKSVRRAAAEAVRAEVAVRARQLDLALAEAALAEDDRGFLRAFSDAARESAAVGAEVGRLLVYLPTGE